MGTKGLVALLLAVLGVGFLAGRMTAEPRKEPRRARDTRAPAPETEPMTRRTSPAEERVPAEEPTDGGTTDAEAALRQLVADASAASVLDTASRAAEIRRRALLTAKGAEFIAARQVADELKRERALLEDKERAGAMAVLRGLRKQPSRLFELVTDQPRFAEFFERHTDGGAINGESLQRGVPIPDGTTLSFGPGVSEWKSSDLRSTFPKDLVIEGRGMDTTLVKLDKISTRAEVHSLTFRDCTIDCGNRYFTDLRTWNPVTIRMIRCRVIRFDNGAGGSVMLAARSAAFYASNCRFESGFGRSPGSGNLFRVRSGLLVRIEDSTFVGPFRSIYDIDRAATYVFERCRFEQQRVPLDKPPVGVRFIDCSSTPPPTGPRRKTRPLSDINPRWTAK